MRVLSLLTAAAAAALLVAAPAVAAPPTGVHAAGCAAAPADPGRYARCFAQFRVPSVVRALDGEPAGLSPADIADAYALRGDGGAGQVVAIVDAFDNPKAERDLAAYRSTFGLPACTSANGCFRKVNQRGDRAPLPAPDAGWGLEIALDLDAVSAACPQCSIVLVEGDSNSFRDLSASVDTAVRLGADVVSNSYGGPEFAAMTRLARHYQHPGVSMVASSGDDGFGVPTSFPAVLRSTIAVGGTSLVPSTNGRGWRETAWAGAGSGCSAYIPKPAWQHDDHCTRRTVADVSAVADPDTGLAVYDTFGLGPYNGWLVVGGTSLSAPLISAMIARSGTVLDGPSSLYDHAADLHDIVGGSNGFCGGDYLCTGVRGYDGPTGMGTPRGLAAL